MKINALLAVALIPLCIAMQESINLVSYNGYRPSAQRVYHHAVSPQILFLIVLLASKTLCSSVGIPAKVSYESQLASHGGVDTKVTEPETAMRIKALCCKAKFEPD